MYDVSNAYKAIVRSHTQAYYSQLRINIDGTNYTDDDVMSMSLDNQCSESSDVMIGAVYVGELSISFKKGINIARSTWKGRTIKPYYRLRISDNNYEEVPLGVFEVDEATYSAGGVEVKAYDYMAKFDKKIVLNQSSGTPYSFIMIACNNCGVTLGMTENEVQALPNGSQALTYYSDNDVETYRDLINRIAQIFGGFATIDRLGHLVFKSFSQTAVDSIDIYRRTNSSKFSDYVTSYTGMSYVSLSDNQTHYHGLPDDTGLTMNIGANPFLQGGTSTYINTLCDNILTAISGIQYTPHEVTVGGYPAFDLGDLIEYTDGLAGVSSNCCIMSYTYNYHQGYSMKGYGKDPALSTARSKVDKNISGLMDKVSEDAIIFTSFTNADPISIGDSEKETIIDIKFASNKATYLIFMAEILGEVETSVNGITYNDAEIKISYEHNHQEIVTYYPRQVAVDGKHIISLMYTIPVDNNVINTWKVKLEMSGGSISIPAENIKATIYGQGLVATDEWDGYLDFEEAVSAIQFTNVSISSIGIDISTALDTPIGDSFTEAFGSIAFTNVTTQVTEFIAAYITERGLINSENLPTYDTQSVEIVDDAFVVMSGATVPQYLTKKVIDVEDVTEILSVNITATNITMQFSNDGTTWKSFINDTWQETQTEMTVNDVTALTNAEWLDLITSGVLWVRISLNVANSSLTEFEIIYTEGVYE